MTSTTYTESPEWRRFENQRQIKGTVGLLAFPGGLIAGILVDPVLGVAMFMVFGKAFKTVIDAPNPYAK